MLKTLLLIIAFLCFRFNGFAQLILGGNLQVGIPVGDFAKNTNSTGVGFSVHALGAISPKTPIFIGLEVGYMIYGSTVNKINTNVSFLNTNIPLNYRVETSNNLLNFHTMIRFVAPINAFKLYFDGLVGGRYIYTRTAVLDNSPRATYNINNNNYTYQNRTISARTNLDDWIFSYGGGIGACFNILGEHVQLDTRIIYLWGAEALYLDQEAVRDANPPIITSSGNNIGTDYTFQTKKSRTDMVFAHIGIFILF